MGVCSELVYQDQKSYWFNIIAKVQLLFACYTMTTFLFLQKNVESIVLSVDTFQYHVGIDIENTVALLPVNL